MQSLTAIVESVDYSKVSKNTFLIEYQILKKNCYIFQSKEVGQIGVNGPVVQLHVAQGLPHGREPVQTHLHKGLAVMVGRSKGNSVVLVVTAQVSRQMCTYVY